MFLWEQTENRLDIISPVDPVILRIRICDGATTQSPAIPYRHPSDVGWTKPLVLLRQTVAVGHVMQVIMHIQLSLDIPVIVHQIVFVDQMHRVDLRQT